MKNNLLFALLALPMLPACHAPENQHALVGADWIGTDEVVLNAPYLQEFSLDFDVKTGGGEAAFLFGGNDERLMTKNLNHMGVESRKDEVYMSLCFEGNEVALKRKGYENDGREHEVVRYTLPSHWLNDTLHINAIVMQGLMALKVNDSLMSDQIHATPCEQTGGDYIPYPVLGEIGTRGEATFAHVEVRNIRTPYTLLYHADTLNDQPLFDPSHMGMPELYSTLKVKNKAIESAILYASARGIYEVYLNAQKVGNDYFAPGCSQYNRTHYYQTYDVRDMLHVGDNDILALLGEGWWMGTIGYWSQGVNHFGDQLAFIAKLVVRYEDGEEQVLTTNDQDWTVATDGPIRYSSRFHGEIIDARQAACSSQKIPAKVMKLDGHLPSEKAFNTPVVDDYTHFQLLPQPDEGVRVRGVLTAQSVEQVRKGVYVYDMGQNMAGLPEITFRHLQAGQRVRMRFAEVRYPDMPEYALNKGMVMMENIRAAFAQDLYYAAGGAEETFAPHFTLHGYRYVEITGIDEALPLEDVRGRVLSSVTLASDFECSNPLVNRLWKNIQWSTLGNFISIPTDCPQRNERLGWGGDISVYSRTSTYVSDNYDFLRRHLRNIRDLQEENGRFPDIAPVGGGFGGFLWGSSGVTLAYEAWRQTGKLQVVEEHYDAMKRYMEYVKHNYIDPETGLFVQTGSWGDLGDWLNLEYFRIDKTGQFECYYIFDLQCMAQMAYALGNYADAEAYEQTARARKAFYVDHYVDKNTGKSLYSAYMPELEGKEADYEASYVLPLAFGVIEDDVLRQKMVDNLVATIERENSTDQGVICPPYSLMTGFVTTAWISKALTDNGRADVAYRLLQTTTYPSWLYPVTQGATTIWERLNSYNDFEGFGGNNSMNSFNHYSFGAVGQWLMSRVLGIERDAKEAGFRHFELRPLPDPTHQMTYAQGYLNTSFGTVFARWERVDGGRFSYSFTIPEGCSATLFLPDGTTSEYQAGSHNVMLMEMETN
ncbi:MAG: glycoside hydrolase family 78 protein [Paludibacteraceae bacterium]|nr:glycoside hydrolase family 78 protein [Paludibacteraceae bacterium]